MILLKDCFYLHSPEVSDPQAGWDVLLDGGRISRIDRDIRSSPEVTEEIDCSRHVVLPGFVNTHHHFYQTLTRNLPAAQDAKLFDWLVYHYPIWAHIDEEAVAISTQLACAELLKTGCTCTTDHHYLYPRSFQGDLAGIQFQAAGNSACGSRPPGDQCPAARARGGSLLTALSSLRRKSWKTAGGLLRPTTIPTRLRCER